MFKDDGYLLDMLLAGRLLTQFSEGSTWEKFNTDMQFQSAIRYQEQVLGEAANKVSHARRLLQR